MPILFVTFATREWGRGYASATEHYTGTMATVHHPTMRTPTSRSPSAPTLLLLAGALASLTTVIPAPRAAAQQQSFSDVPPTHVAFQAVEYLRSQGIISGYADGTFQPQRKVNRAEAVKIIVAPLVKPEELAQAVTTVYNDVPAGAWYLAYIELARQRFNIIDGPPKKTAFAGERPVIKAEFLKMVLLAHRVDPNAFSEIRLPLAIDVTSPQEWYYPYLRYALTSSMTMVGEDGLLSPGRELTRGEVALLLHRFLMYREGRRTQALLSEAESELLNILGFLEKNDITMAEYASARALLAARGAHARQPDVPIVRGALKVTEGFRSLVRAYRAGVTQDFPGAIALAREAWQLADQAKQMSPALGTIADQVQASAKTMADSAREWLQKQGAPPPA